MIEVSSDLLNAPFLNSTHFHSRRSADLEHPHRVYVNGRLAQTKSLPISLSLTNHIPSRDQGIVPPTSSSHHPRQVRRVQGKSNSNGSTSVRSRKHLLPSPPQNHGSDMALNPPLALIPPHLGADQLISPHLKISKISVKPAAVDSIPLGRQIWKRIRT